MPPQKKLKAKTVRNKSKDTEREKDRWEKQQNSSETGDGGRK